MCEPATGCSNPPIADDTPCDDSDACTQTDLCKVGQCKGSNPPSCDDGKQCTQDSCDPATGCVHTLITPCCGNDIKEAGEECDD